MWARLKKEIEGLEPGHVYDVDEDGRDMKSLVGVQERENPE